MAWLAWLRVWDFESVESKILINKDGLDDHHLAFVECISFRMGFYG
jgi:hypothetical protein